MKGIDPKEGPPFCPLQKEKAGQGPFSFNIIFSILFSKWYPFVSQESLVMKQHLNKVIWVKQASEKKEGSVTASVDDSAFDVKGTILDFWEKESF